MAMLLLFVDWCAWRIVRLPLKPFYLMRPFCISAVLVSCAGYVCVPLLRIMKIGAIIRKEGPAKHSSKKGTPTMGGLFFIPIGIVVAEVLVGFSSIEVSGAAAVTLIFAAIGLLDDILSLIKNHNYGLSSWIRILLEVKFVFLPTFNILQALMVANILSDLKLWCYTGSCWDVVFILVSYHKDIITLQHVYLLVTNLFNICLMVTHIYSHIQVLKIATCLKV